MEKNENMMQSNSHRYQMNESWFKTKGSNFSFKYTHANQSRGPTCLKKFPISLAIQILVFGTILPIYITAIRRKLHWNGT